MCTGSATVQRTKQGDMQNVSGEANTLSLYRHSSKTADFPYHIVPGYIDFLSTWNMVEGN